MNRSHSGMDKHMLTGQTVLIVESEFLIALDIQRCLETFGATQTVFARNTDEVFNAVERWPSFAVALVEVRHQDNADAALLRALADAGMKLILLTADATLRGGHPGFPVAPVVMKPFLEEDLASALQQALAN